MTVVLTLPAAPQYNAGQPYLFSQAQDLVSPLGGATQRVIRLGTRFGIDVTYPAMKYGDGMVFLSRMIQAETNPVAVAFPQRGLTIGDAGAVVVNGDGQTGLSLGVRGVTAGYTFDEGQFLSFITGGRRYLHVVTAAATAAGSGAVTLAVYPMLRVVPNDGDAVEVATPHLEGFISLQSKKLPWTIEMVRRVGLKFTVVEDR